MVHGLTIEQTVPLLIVTDLAVSQKFYCDGLGFEIRERWESDGKLAWCWLTNGGASLMLQQRCEADPPAGDCGRGVTFYFVCNDANQMHERLTSAGIAASEPAVAFYGMNQTFVRDPDRYELCFENRC